MLTSAITQDPEGEAQQQVVRPVCVALVDTTGTEEHLELVRCSLLAALEALQPCTGFGLATFSDKVCPRPRWAQMPKFVPA
jgi:hypothetical protein